MLNKKLTYYAPLAEYSTLAEQSVICESGEAPDYEPITDFNW